LPTSSHVPETTVSAASAQAGQAPLVHRHHACGRAAGWCGVFLHLRSEEHAQGAGEVGDRDHHAAATAATSTAASTTTERRSAAAGREARGGDERAGTRRRG